ncbi:hypothetical protein VP01_681g1 [Puccinia sorghi]|uniref:Retrovirus-related Pol polyprotein from transposon TNT 1-94-like beta-barrel domain-containing protein n=1 Tax=Puccinia sorghi TaxID=27349 RepID=A0A0L6UEF0_9BASI|nr:hypothetical protein VP01_681g1 [Puccinia sorghi]
MPTSSITTMKKTLKQFGNKSPIILLLLKHQIQYSWFYYQFPQPWTMCLSESPIRIKQSIPNWPLNDFECIITINKLWEEEADQKMTPLLCSPITRGSARRMHTTPCLVTPSQTAGPCIWSVAQLISLRPVEIELKPLSSLTQALWLIWCVICTSSGMETLKIEGIGTIKLINKLGVLLLNQVLYVPDLIVNLLSVCCFILEDYDVLFQKNLFEIYKNKDLKVKGCYVGNLPSLNFENVIPLCHLSNSKILHKSLGHISYSRLRKNLGLPLKIKKTCESCAVSKITKGTFNSKHRRASKFFEEVHLDLIGPIWPSSQEGHKYILTFVDSHSHFCSAIPLKHKSNVFEQLTYMLNIEAKRNLSTPKFKLTARNITFRLKPLISLTLNQISAHRSKKSPFEIFKNRSLPFNYFHPIGNKVLYLILPEQLFSKVKPKGSLGKLIGYNDELLSFRILTEDGRIIETKHVEFLDFDSPKPASSDDDFESICEEEEGSVVDENEAVSLEVCEQEEEGDLEGESSNEDTSEVTVSLIPTGQIL